MDKALSLFGLGATEKAVDGAFGSIKSWVDGRNALDIEREKTKQCAIKGGVVLGIAALFAWFYDEIDFSVGDNHCHAAKR